MLAVLRATQMQKLICYSRLMTQAVGRWTLEDCLGESSKCLDTVNSRDGIGTGWTEVGGISKL